MSVGDAGDLGVTAAGGFNPSDAGAHSSRLGLGEPSIGEVAGSAEADAGPRNEVGE